MAQTVYYGREYEERKERQKKTKKKAEAFTMAMKNVLKQPEKDAKREPDEKGWACYYCGKEGHLKQDYPQTSKLPPAPCPVCKGPHWKRDCPRGVGLRGQTLKTIRTEGARGPPHKLPS